MAAAPPPKPEPARPGLPRTIGIFNLIFGGLLLLCGLGCLNLSVPGLLKNPNYRIDPKQVDQVTEQMRRQIITELRQKEASAPTEAEKARLRGERQQIEANPGSFAARIDIRQANRALKDLWRYVWAEVVSGPVLNLLLLISGIGLILLKNWARVLAVVVAALKLVRLVALCAFATVVVLPGLTRMADDMARTEVGKAVMTKSMEDQRARQGGAAPAQQMSAEDLVRVLKAFGMVYFLAVTCLGAIYPVIVLVVLTRPGARAACAADAEPGWEAPSGSGWSP